MTKLIKTDINEKIAIVLQEQWTKQCQTRELKSIEFSKKEKWFTENWMSVSKSKHEGLRGPIKQENNVKYRTYWRNKYNRDKTKKEIFTDLIPGTEVSKKDTIRQDNSDNVITFQQTNNNHQNNESEQI